jgi:hypothetical protein
LEVILKQEQKWSDVARFAKRLCGEKHMVISK